MRKPSILLINRVYAPAKGATGRLLADLAQGFAADGWDVSVITTGSASSIQKEEGVTVARIKARNQQSFLNYILIWARLLHAALKFKKTDLIVTMTDPPLLAVAGRILAKRKKSYHIHWCQDVYPDLLTALGIKYPKFFVHFLSKLSHRSIRTCSRIVAIGSCMAEYLARTGIDPRRIVIIQNWPDRELTGSDGIQFHEPKIERPVLKNDKPLVVNTDPKFRVLYAGNIGRAHPMQTILEAAGILQISNPEIEFTFVGEGPGHDALAEERARRSLENIKLLPRQPEFKLREMMQSGDIHLISMKKGTLGLLVPSKIYSALAAERPCIFVGPEQCEAAQVLQNYHAGKVVVQGDAKALAEAILLYRMDGPAWFEAHKGAEKAHGDFNPEILIKKWINCARSAIRYPAN